MSYTRTRQFGPSREHACSCVRHQKLLRTAQRYTKKRLYRLARILPTQKLVAAIARVMHEREMVDSWFESSGTVSVTKGSRHIQLWPKLQ